MNSYDMQDLLTDYSRAGFGGSLEPGSRPAVVVVDLVRAYVENDSPLFADKQEVVEATERIVRAARKVHVPIFFTCVRYCPGGLDGGIFRRKLPVLRVFDQGSPLAEFLDHPRPAAQDVVIVKQYASAFFGTSLASTLRAMQIDTTVIAGFTTSGCVRATAVDALQSGFVPIVVRDAVGDRDERPHEANLFDLDAKYARIVSEAEATSLIAEAERPRTVSTGEG